MTAAAFAGMPVTAVIARSSLNIKLKAHSRLPSLVQSAFVFGSAAPRCGRLYLGYISAISRLYLGCISAVSRPPLDAGDGTATPCLQLITPETVRRVPELSPAPCPAEAVVSARA